MKFNETIEYTISIEPDQYIDKAFTDRKLPSNAFIHKGRCGIGGTTLELKFPRHSIITVPTVGIIGDKLKSTKDLPYGLIGVMSGTNSVQKIKDGILKALNTTGAYIKIMSTPDSFNNIMEAAKGIEGFNIEQECFLLLDECHTFISERFRKKIFKPFSWFWEFDNKSVISATPYYFTDKRFEKFDHHRIKFFESYRGEVEIVNATSVSACLNHAITKMEYPGNVHIFYNSVTDCVSAIKRAGLTEGNIFFSDKSENHEKLAGFGNFYQDEPSDKVYKKFNFYTCKYIEGWDLFDKDETLIVVTDIYSPHTKIRISNKGVQAVGRSRNIPHKIYHITNRRNTDKMKTEEQITNDYQIQARGFIKLFNQMVAQGVQPMQEFEDQVLKFADLDAGKVVYNPTKFDQMVNEQLCNEEYANMAMIGKQWEAGLYKPLHFKYEERLVKDNTKEKRKSKSDKIRDAVHEIERLELEKSEFAFNSGNDQLADFIKSNPFAYEAYKLGKEELNKLQFNEVAIKATLISKSNITAEMKVKRLLNETFKVNFTYLKSDIKRALQRIYSMADLKDKRGNIRTATAEQLEGNGRYELQETKKKVNNKWEPAFKILRAQFELKIAA